jgi:hypothetical protein
VEVGGRRLDTKGGPGGGRGIQEVGTESMVLRETDGWMDTIWASWCVLRMSRHVRVE